MSMERVVQTEKVLDIRPKLVDGLIRAGRD